MKYTEGELIEIERAADRALAKMDEEESIERRCAQKQARSTEQVTCPHARKALEAVEQLIGEIRRLQRLHILHHKFTAPGRE